MRWKLFSAFAILHFLTASLNLKVGFDYDDTLSFSTPAFDAAFAAQGVEPFSENFWRIVNSNQSREETKWGVAAWAILCKILGFDVVIITARMPVASEELIESWDWLHDGFYFTKEKARIMERHSYVAFIGDSDSDIEEARKAGVWAIRARRSSESSYKENYSPGKYDEWVLPFSG